MWVYSKHYQYFTLTSKAYSFASLNWLGDDTCLIIVWHKIVFLDFDRELY